MEDVALIECRVVKLANSSEGSGEWVMEDVNWLVRPGDFWVLAGHMGPTSGQFISALAGLELPDIGEVHLFGKLTQELSGEAWIPLRKRMGIVFEAGQRLIQNLTLAENITLPWRYHHNQSGVKGMDHLAELIDSMGLTEWAHRYPGETSRYIRHRASLARALALQPDLLLLDHPLSGLDPLEKAWWVEYLTRLSQGQEARWMNGKKITLVMTTDQIGPWKGRARQFGLLHHKVWHWVEKPSDWNRLPDDSTFRELLSL